MSILVILLPPRERLSVRAADGAPGPRLPAELDFVLSADGRRATQTGRAPLALLPRADTTVLVLAEGDVSWHRINVPKAPPARLRAALAGVMEDNLLEDEASLHFALAPGAVGGQPGWVAVMHRAWLASVLAGLEQGGRSIERVVPSSLPTSEPGTGRGHFFDTEPGIDTPLWLALAQPGGVVCLRLAGALARALQPAPEVMVQWSATPAAAAAAERWLGAPVAVMTAAERALESAQIGAQSGVNLRQFELAPRRRGTRAVRDWGRRFQSAEWRPVRWGLVGLVAVQLVGLNAWAWQQRQAVAERKLAMVDLLRSTHTGVRAVLDAPVQMERETDRLRAAAGRAGDSDLEALLAAAAAAWPDGQGPVQTLRFESGRLTVAASGWGEAQLAQFRERLRAAGYAADAAEGRVTVTRQVAAATGGAA
jgi:general secretion pathway protein L